MGSGRPRNKLRWVTDLGLYALERGEGSCVWRTSACDRCYNRDIARFSVLLRMSWRPGGPDDRRWESARAETFSGLDRVRLCTRGEPITNGLDVHRIAEWARANPETLFWLTTRSWQTGAGLGHKINRPMMGAIESVLFPVDNVRVMASMDAFTSQHFGALNGRGWSTTYFGTEAPHPSPDAMKCRKTWQKIKGACASCEDGCFSARQVHVWLREHGSHRKPSPQMELTI